MDLNDFDFFIDSLSEVALSPRIRSEMQKVMENNFKVQSLVDRARSGDREAFDELVKRFQQPLYDSLASWLRFRVGPRVDIEDVIQDCFLRAYSSLDRFVCPDHDEEDAFLRWICGIAKHSLGDLMRKASREAPSTLMTDPPAGATTESRVLRREERFERCQKALDKLPSGYREALVLARLEGLSAKEIAKRMDRTPDAVYQLIARGLKLLREEFGDTESLHLPDRQLRREAEDNER